MITLNKNFLSIIIIYFFFLYEYRIERDLHLAKAKISELENIQILNKKYLLDEELVKQVHQTENKKLNDELDNLTKMNEVILSTKLKENERNQTIQIKNTIGDKEVRMNKLLDKYRNEENQAKDFLEQKNQLIQNLAILNSDISNSANLEQDQKIELIELKNAIDEHKIIIEEEKKTLAGFNIDNDRLRKENEKLEAEIKSIYKKTEEVSQKIELNNLLKDIDVNELKMLSQNNAIVNSSINSLLGKWDKIHSKLDELNKK